MRPRSPAAGCYPFIAADLTLIVYSPATAIPGHLLVQWRQQALPASSGKSA
jgi:hypothetical protein